MGKKEVRYNDLLEGVKIEEVVVEGGYELKKGDGLGYGWYVKVESDGEGVRGEKFIVRGNGKWCFEGGEEKK